MIKKLLFLLISCTGLAAQSIAGFWKSIDDETGKPRCVVAVYEYKDMYYGRMIATFDDTGKVKETIYAPKGRAPGVLGNPYYCGLDFIWNLRDRGSKFKGKIMDPEAGSIYNAELWVENGNLIVRGKLLFFGKSQTWLPATQADFPKGFKMPDTAKFVPEVPEAS